MPYVCVLSIIKFVKPFAVGRVSGPLVHKADIPAIGAGKQLAGQVVEGVMDDRTEPVWR
jgi:hypothetical protein